MITTTSDLVNLPTESSNIANTIECTKCLQQITNVPKNQAEAEHVLKHIAAVIEKEANFSGAAESNDFPTINQVVLNLAFRSYFQLLQRHELEDQVFSRIYNGQFWNNYLGECQMLYAILLTDQSKNINSSELKNKLLAALETSVRTNNGALLAVLKALNLLCKKFPTLEVHLSLDLVYNCMQSNSQVGVRDETLVLFTHCCKSRDAAFAYFKVISEFWPWTNRNKYFLLSCIFQLHDYREFLHATGHSSVGFFAGIRLSLHYKHLLACSQYLVKSLSSCESEELLQLTADVLTRGSMQEIQNLYSHWFGRIAKKDRLFELLQNRPEIAIFLEDSQNSLDDVENYRLILIFSLFSRQIFSISKLHFFKFSTELITNCFQYENNSQLLIYKFIVDNLSIFSIEDCLEFILDFVQRHKTIENSHFRNNILGKVPTIINYISKTFNKMKATADFTTLGSSISTFFRQIQQFVEADISSKLYQPKIFSLKLLEILLKSLYSQRLEKNAKNCSIAQNQQLGVYLIEQEIFNNARMAEKLLALLNDPLGFDDALELIVALLQLLGSQDGDDTAAKSLSLCRDFCRRCDIDQCTLSTLYAKVALQSSKQPASAAAQLNEYVLSALGQNELQVFQDDPLEHCKTKYHLFGYLNVIVENEQRNSMSSFTNLVDLTETILNLILKMLNLKTVNTTSSSAASFQDMDESLQLLVEKSRFSECSHEESRKFLLMSFWLTLKACCDLATVIGCHVVSQTEDSDENLKILERCLQVNVTVLTRCRHKGAIEAAGVTIGKLTKCITSQMASNTRAYELLHNCLKQLFDDDKQVSTTRRGAGFSIMFLHVVKNEEERSRPILKRAMANILQRLQKSSSTSKTTADNEQACETACVDRIESLTLHYLCVLVRDTELRDAMSKYHSDIILAAMQQIDHSDWTICNAALQLFGALIPKIVGQKQATDYEQTTMFDSTEITFSEMTSKLPVACENIVQYCIANSTASTCTRSIILFLSFFAKVDHVRKSEADAEASSQFLYKFRQLMWQLLRHASEKVRQLAAQCFVRAHEFRCDLPRALLGISQIIYQINDENFFEGLLFTLSAGVQKIRHESKHTVHDADTAQLMDNLRINLAQNFNENKYKLYTLSKVLDVMRNLRLPSADMFASVSNSYGTTSIGYDVWQTKLNEFAAATAIN